MSQRYEVELRGGYMGAAPVNDKEFVPQLWAVMDTATDIPVVAFAPESMRKNAVTQSISMSSKAAGPISR